MKLVRYRAGDEENYGLIDHDKVVSLPHLSKSMNEEFPKRIEDLIMKGTAEVGNAERVLEKATEKEIRDASFQTQNLTLLAPIVYPPKIICLGLNYKDHIEEQRAETPDEPIIFMKPRTAIIGPKENIIKPSFVKQLDYEGELAVVVGKKAKNVSTSDATDYIFGYTILNDVSARDFQFKDKQWTRGKGFDTFAPTGPCITTKNQLRDTTNLRIRTWVNDELRQDSTTRNMIFDISEIVHQISRFMTLEPLDLIATGTPKGVGFAMKPSPKFLKNNDMVRIEIEGIGTLENRVVEANF